MARQDEPEEQQTVIDDIIFVACFAVWQITMVLVVQFASIPRDYFDETEDNRVVPVYTNPGEDSEIVLDPIEGENDEERYDF